MKKQLLLLLAITLLFGSNCKKDEPTVSTGPDGYIAGQPLDSLGLPYPTQEGLNTMGCLINGEPWLPLKENLVGDLVYHIPFSITGGGGVFIQGVADNQIDESNLNLAANLVLNPGEYPFDEIEIVYDSSIDDCGYFFIDSTYYNHFVFTTVDFVNEIVSGTFELRATSSNCDTLTFSQGRFDLSSE